MSVPPVVALESRLRRDLSIAPEDRVTITAGDRPGVSWEASWGLEGLAWSPMTIYECNRANAWRVSDDGEGGLVVTSRSAKAVGSALRGRKRKRPPQVRVHAGQVWADRAGAGRTIMITDPDDNGRVRYRTLTLADDRLRGKPWGRIARRSLLSAYKLLPPDHPAYEGMRRDAAVRYPQRWVTGTSGNYVTARFEDDEQASADLERWLSSEAAWLAFRDWAFATEGDRRAAPSVGLRATGARRVQVPLVPAMPGAAADPQHRVLGESSRPAVEVVKPAGVEPGTSTRMLRSRDDAPGRRSGPGSRTSTRAGRSRTRKATAPASCAPTWRSGRSAASTSSGCCAACRRCRKRPGRLRDE